MPRIATHIVREEVIRIFDEDRCLLAEIHVGRFTPNKFSVFLGSMEMFLTDKGFEPLEVDSLDEALERLYPWFPQACIPELIKAHPGIYHRVNHYPISGE